MKITRSLAVSCTAAATALILTAGSALASGVTVSGTAPTTVANGYSLQADCWHDCSGTGVTATDANSDDDFTVATGAGVATNGPPEAYPSLYAGNHFSSFSSYDPFYSSGSGGTAKYTAADVGNTTDQVVTTLVTTPDATAGDVWDDSYDIWFASSASHAAYQNDKCTVSTGCGLEMMIWQNYSGSSPAGSKVASDVYLDTVNGYYNVWYNPPQKNATTGYYSDGTVTYQAADKTAQVDDLNLGPFVYDAETRTYAGNAYLNYAYYLIDVEAGFETWKGGVNSTVNNFAVNVTAGQFSYTGFIVTQMSSTGSGNDLYVDDPAGAASNGTLIKGTSSGYDTAGEQWLVELNSATGYDSVHLASDPSYCLQVANNGTTNGTKVELYTCNNNTDQEWDPNGYGQGLFAVYASSKSGKTMMLDDPNGASGADLQIWQTDGDNQQDWTTPGDLPG